MAQEFVNEANPRGWYDAPVAAPAEAGGAPDPTMERLEDGTVRKRRDICMRYEIESWKRERRARWFAIGCVLVLVGVVIVCVVSDPLTSYGFGGVLLAAGIVLVGRWG